MSYQPVTPNTFSKGSEMKAKRLTAFPRSTKPVWDTFQNPTPTYYVPSLNIATSINKCLTINTSFMKPLFLIFAFLSAAAIISGALGNHTHYLVAIPLAITAIILWYSHKYEQTASRPQSTENPQTPPKKAFRKGDKVFLNDYFGNKCSGTITEVSPTTVRVKFTDSLGTFHNTIFFYDQVSSPAELETINKL